MGRKHFKGMALMLAAAVLASVAFVAPAATFAAPEEPAEPTPIEVKVSAEATQVSLPLAVDIPGEAFTAIEFGLSIEGTLAMPRDPDGEEEGEEGEDQYADYPGYFLYDANEFPGAVKPSGYVGNADELTGNVNSDGMKLASDGSGGFVFGFFSSVRGNVYLSGERNMGEIRLIGYLGDEPLKATVTYLQVTSYPEDMTLPINPDEFITTFVEGPIAIYSVSRATAEDPDPTPDPTADPTPDPTTDPTPDPTADPTADPTPDPTADPTQAPPSVGGGGGSGLSSGATAIAPLDEAPEDEAVEVVDEGPLPGGAADIESHVHFIEGYPDGSMMADANITRAEAVTMLYRLSRDVAAKSGASMSRSIFSDVSEGDWHIMYVNFAVGEGYVVGYPDGTFMPDQNITRAEFAALAARYAGEDEGVAGGVSFADVPGDHWAIAQIAACAANGWVMGYPDGSFMPEAAITRAEAAAVLNRVTGRSVKAENIPGGVAGYTGGEGFTDLAESHWAYMDVIEASVDHSFTRNEDGDEVWVGEDATVESDVPEAGEGTNADGNVAEAGEGTSADGDAAESGEDTGE